MDIDDREAIRHRGQKRSHDMFANEGSLNDDDDDEEWGGIEFDDEPSEEEEDLRSRE